MNVVTDYLPISTKGRTDIIDITADLARVLKNSGLSTGTLLVFVSGSTAGVTTIEFEPGLLQDLPETFERIAPMGKRYHHDATWGDGNGYAHVRASLLGSSETIPFKDGKMLLGTWQQVVVIDFDNRSRNREIVIQMMGK